MPPPSQIGNNVLDRTIRNIEQAQGRSRHHTTAADILQAQASNGSGLVSLPSTSSAPSVDDHDAAASISPLQVNANTLINLTSDLAASTTLLQSLRVRNNILIDDLARETLSLQQHEGTATKLLFKVHRSRAKWMAAAIVSFAIWAAYLWWCWYMRVEFEYIWRRRAEVFRL